MEVSRVTEGGRPQVYSPPSSHTRAAGNWAEKEGGKVKGARGEALSHIGTPYSLFVVFYNNTSSILSTSSAKIDYQDPTTHLSTLVHQVMHHGKSWNTVEHHGT